MATHEVDVPDLLALARRRTEVTSLKQILIKYVAENAGGFIRGEDTLENLPFLLREMVLGQLMQLRDSGNVDNSQEYIMEMIQAYSQLISQATKKVELTGFISFCRKPNTSRNTTTILEAILQKAAGLEHLDLRYNSIKFLLRCPALKNNSIEAILRMENLKMIQFWVVKFEHVKHVCKNLKNLQHVECTYLKYERADEENIVANIEDFKSSFSRLRVFLFEAFSFAFERNLAKLCIQHLNLHVVRDFADIRYGSNRVSPELPIPEELETYTLRHLHSTPSAIDLPAAFPHVTHLNAICTWHELEGAHNSILKFDNIDSLALYLRPNDSTLNSFLEAYGANLHTLVIEAEYSYYIMDMPYINFSFERIFDACPKLQKLELHRVHILDDKKPLKSFAQLRELHWYPKYDLRHFCDLSNILAAPNLHKFTFPADRYKISTESLRKLTSLVAEKKILGQLTNLHLDLCQAIDAAKIKYEFLMAFRDFLAVAAAHLPKLVDVKIVLRCKNHIVPGVLTLNSHDEKHISFIGKKFKQWIGDDSIAKFIRVFNARARNQL